VSQRSSPREKIRECPSNFSFTEEGSCETGYLLKSTAGSFYLLFSGRGSVRPPPAAIA